MKDLKSKETKDALNKTKNWASWYFLKRPLYMFVFLAIVCVILLFIGLFIPD